jgi:glyoxylase-like metal-dependent hydrolase (beta-lactamase superfamily II)
MEVVPGLHWVESIWDTKVYVLLERERIVLVDAAMPGRAGSVWRYLDSLGYPPEAVEEIWITHGDIDHMGSAAALKAQSGARVVVHRADVPLVEGRADRVLGPVPLNGVCQELFNWAIARVFRYQAVTVDCPVEDGQDLGGWQVVHVPGHTAGSVAFYHPERKVVIVGDALNYKRGQLGAPPRVVAPDMAQAHDSIRKLAALRFDVCCFGHGPPLVEETQKRVRAFADSL